MTTRIDDGHSTRIGFANYPSVKIYEKEVTPVGVQGGGAVDVTNMRNSVWRTFASKKLKSLSEASGVYAYDPAAYSDMITMVNENQLITITFPDSATVSFWGWVDEFTPQRHVEGTQPLAEVKILASNLNAAKEETAPVLG